METITKKDSRISRDLCVRQFEAIANEYLAEYGRKTSGGSRMTWDTFECWSYAKDRTEKQIDICIHYESQTISMTTIS